MKITPTPLSELVIIETNKHQDSRGSFMRIFCQLELAGILGKRSIVQVNKSLTNKKGTIRGLHFQKGVYAEMKLIRCIKGKIFDVAVDLRGDSPTFLHWYSEVLTPENNKMIVVPEGFAHGFQSLESETEVLYMTTAEYRADFEGGILFNDSMLNIQWPLKCSEISEKDSKHILINGDFTGIDLK